MALHFCKWADDRVSILVDAESEDAAREVATDIAEGDAPASVVVLAPRVFVAEVIFEEDEDDAPFPTIEPLEHTIEVLSVLEDGEAHGSVAPDASACGESAEAEGGEVVFCELDAEHETPHEAQTSVGEMVHWPR